MYSSADRLKHRVNYNSYQYLVCSRVVASALRLLPLSILRPRIVYALKPPYFARKIFLTERFDEGLMVLRRILGWSMIDMTYMKLNQTKAGVRRYDGKPLLDPPAFDDLPEKARRGEGCQGVLSQTVASSNSSHPPR